MAYSDSTCSNDSVLTQLPQLKSLPYTSRSPQIPNASILPTGTLPTGWAIKNTPTDVWRVIFGIHVLKSLDNSPQSSSFKRAFHLSHICSTWRAIAIDAPELWSKITVYIQPNGSAYPPMDLLLLCLQHSGSTPLTMRVVVEDILQFYLNGGRSGEAVVLRFLSEIPRARHLRLDGPVIQQFCTDPEDLKKYGLEPCASAPFLEELACIRVPSAFKPLVMRMWANAPDLHTVTIGGEAIFGMESISVVDGDHFPLHQLTTLELGFLMNEESFFAILSKTKKLVQGKFGHILQKPTFYRKYTPENPLLLSGLEILGLGEAAATNFAHGSSSLTGLLRYIKAPALKSLGVRHDCLFSLPSLKFFFHNSQCDIQHLSLDNESLSDEEQIECLQSLPWLRSLRVFSVRKRFTETFIEDMQKLDASKREFLLIPQLECMTIDLGLLHQSRSMFSDMVEARWRQLEKKFKVVVWESSANRRRSDNPHELTCLLDLQKEGLDLKFEPSHDIDGPNW